LVGLNHFTVPRAIVDLPIDSGDFILIGGLAANAATAFYTSEILTVAWSHTANIIGLLWEMEMAKTNLASMSVDALLKLRGDIERTLSHKATQLKEQLSRLSDEASGYKRSRGSSLRGRKVAIKYRDKSGNTWAGRGAQPVWLREKLKAGAKLEDFAVQKTVASRKASPRKSKKRRRAKR
jgi:DNA-binding protein H-NS